MCTHAQLPGARHLHQHSGHKNSVMTPPSVFHAGVHHPDDLPHGPSRSRHGPPARSDGGSPRPALRSRAGRSPGARCRPHRAPRSATEPENGGPRDDALERILQPGGEPPGRGFQVFSYFLEGGCLKLLHKAPELPAPSNRSPKWRLL